MEPSLQWCAQVPRHQPPLQMEQQGAAGVTSRPYKWGLICRGGSITSRPWKCYL